MKKLLLGVLAAFGLGVTGAHAEGGEGGSFRNISVSEAAVMVEQTGNLLIIDVRTAAEFAAGHIPGAIQIDYYASDFAEQLGKLRKSGPVLLYCRSGNRSGKSMPTMRTLGFQSVSNMKGGFLSWQAGNHPTAP